MGIFIRLYGNFAYFCGVAHAHDYSFGMAVHHHRRTKNKVFGVGTLVRSARFLLCNAMASGLFGFIFRRVGRYGLRSQGLSCKARFVDLQVNGRQKLCISRNLIAYFNKDNVAHDDVSARNFGHITVSAHLDRLVFVQRREHTELLFSVAFKVKSNSCCQENSDENTNRFNKIVLDKGKNE